MSCAVGRRVNSLEEVRKKVYLRGPSLRRADRFLFYEKMK